MEYCLKEFSSVEEIKTEVFYELSSYHWEAELPYRPKVYANIGVVNGSLVAVLKCYEANPRTECTKRDDPIYTDSCLELFVAPVSGRKEYVNVECNSKGVFLCEFGDGKYNRSLVSQLTALSPTVDGFSGEDANGVFWGVCVELTKFFVADLYKMDCGDISFDSIRLNFYKCGDGCEIQHYVAFAPVTDLPPGFHNPDCFVAFKKEI
jgi:hypothetical protein